MHYIKDIFEDTPTQHSHDKFIRYSKGVFVGPLINIKFTKTNVKISASFHFVDELLVLATKVLGNKDIFVKGSIVWNEDLSPKLATFGIKYSKVSKSRGIYKYQLENEVRFKDFIDSMRNYNILLTMKTDEVSVSTKSSFPKPNKEFGADFCKAIFPKSMAKEILAEFCFDVKEKAPKDVRITHTLEVNDIILPKDAPNFEVARREAKRVGLIKREVTVDGKQTLTEKEFSV